MELLLVGLALLFIALKLLNKVDWTWSAVLMPIWGPAFLAFMFGLVIAVVGA